ncbi:MAG: hypothetical protein GF403_02060 [Candidatus Coatesbacteria bacterium]|nr:hypothetical protein [Candidatus Coatesbacteria bacterium]
MSKKPDQFERSVRESGRRHALRGLLFALLIGVFWLAGHLYTAGLRYTSRLESPIELRGNLYATAAAPEVSAYRRLAEVLLNLPPLRDLTELGDYHLTITLDGEPFSPNMSPWGSCGPLLSRGPGGGWSCEIRLHPVGVGTSFSEVELYLAAYTESLRAYAQAALPEGATYTERIRVIILESQLGLIQALRRRGIEVHDDYAALAEGELAALDGPP